MDEHSISNNPLLHVANVLYLVSYSLRDILWLRVLTVMAMLCLGWCYWACAEHYALGWQAAFLAINLLQIGLLVYERRPVQLTETQKKLHEGPLSPLTPRQVQRFTDKAIWSTIDHNQVLVAEDTNLEELILLLSGEARVVAQGKHIATITEGQFVGEMSFLTGGNTTAEVIAVQPVLCAKWPEKYVQDLIARDQDLGTALQAALGTDLVQKLLKSRDTPLTD